MIVFSIVLLLQLLPFASGTLELHQEFTSSHKVSLRFGMDSQDSTYIELYPHIPKTTLILLGQFSNVFNFSIQLTSPKNREPIGDKIYRRVQLTLNQPWINDTFTTSSGVSVSVSTKINCARNFFGAQCDHFCDSHRAKVGRKRCDMMGRLRCDIGWMGPHCGHSVDPRKCSCQNNGVCVSSRLHNSTVSPQLTPEERLICECSNGFTGERCEIPGFSQFQFTAPQPDSCSVKDACLNGAKCFPNGPKVFCACPIGYIGEFCETSLSTPSPPAVEITAKTEGYSYTIYTLALIFICLLSAAACWTYKIKPKRENALSRGQEPCPYAMPETKTMLINPEAVRQNHKVFTIEDDLKRIEEDRYTMDPTRGSSEYATIQKTSSRPPLPTVRVPDFPNVYV